MKDQRSFSLAHFIFSSPFTVKNSFAAREFSLLYQGLFLDISGKKVVPRYMYCTGEFRLRISGFTLSWRKYCFLLYKEISPSISGYTLYFYLYKGESSWTLQWILTLLFKMYFSSGETNHQVRRFSCRVLHPTRRNTQNKPTIYK